MKVFAFYEGKILLKRTVDEHYTVPEDSDTDYHFSCEMSVTLPNGETVKAYQLTDDTCTTKHFELCGLRQSYYKLPEQLYLAAGKCEELLYWNQSTRFCGRCGKPMELHSAISKRCTACGREIWPQLSTAIIVLIHRGDEVLLVHARNFRGTFFGLVAGFVETGETLEDAVHREVREETNLEITNLRYFGSQPWPYPCGLMVGFHADYVSGEVRLQDSELAAGSWFTRDNLPEIPEKLSIARRLIDDWL